MTTISENLQTIKDSTVNIKNAIINKGGAITGNITTYALAIGDLDLSQSTLISTSGILKVDGILGGASLNNSYTDNVVGIYYMTDINIFAAKSSDDLYYLRWENANDYNNVVNNLEQSREGKIYELNKDYYTIINGTFRRLSETTLAKNITNDLGTSERYVVSQKTVTENLNNLNLLSQEVAAQLNSLGYTYIGTATPSTIPVTLTEDNKVFYIATEEGDYSNFGLGNIGELSIIKSNNGNWKVEGLGVPFNLTELLFTSGSIYNTGISEVVGDKIYGLKKGHTYRLTILNDDISNGIEGVSAPMVAFNYRADGWGRSRFVAIPLGSSNCVELDVPINVTGFYVAASSWLKKDYVLRYNIEDVTSENFLSHFQTAALRITSDKHYEIPTGTEAGTYTSKILNVKGGDTIVASSPVNSIYIAFLKSLENSTISGAEPVFSDFDTNYNRGTFCSLIVPSDANYAVVLDKAKGSNYFPSTFYYNGVPIVVSKEKVLIVDNMLDNKGDNRVGFEFGGLNFDYTPEKGVFVDFYPDAYTPNSIRIRSSAIYFKKGIKSLKLFLFNFKNFTMSRVICMNGNSYVKIIDTQATTSIMDIPIDDSFDNIRVSLKKEDNSEFTEDEVSTIYVCSPQEIWKGEEGPYYGKVYCSLGDSITYGYIPRNYSGYPGQLSSYANLTAKKLGMKFINYGISGSSVANIQGRDPMCIRYADIVDFADVITVMGGTNDVRNGVQLGSMSDRGVDTYYGALHTLLGGLYTKYIANNVNEGKRKKIIVLTPIKLLDKNKSSLPNTIENNANALENWDDWINAVKEVAAFYSLPCLDMYNLSGINPHIDRTIKGYTEGYTGNYNPYITDGTHPTQEGAEIMSEVLCGFLKTLI